MSNKKCKRRQGARRALYAAVAAIIAAVATSGNASAQEVVQGSISFESDRPPVGHASCWVWSRGHDVLAACPGNEWLGSQVVCSLVAGGDFTPRPGQETLFKCDPIAWALRNANGSFIWAAEAPWGDPTAPGRLTVRPLDAVRDESENLTELLVVTESWSDSEDGAGETWTRLSVWKWRDGALRKVFGADPDVDPTRVVVSFEFESDAFVVTTRPRPGRAGRGQRSERFVWDASRFAFVREGRAAPGRRGAP